MISKLKRLAKYLLPNKNAQKRTEFLENVFNKNYDKKVLVSYIISPFVDGLNDRHTNLVECYTACKVFDELNFNVDVIEYNSSMYIEFNSYDVIYGFGAPMEKSFTSGSKKEIKRIIYGTGCDTVFSNKITLERMNSFYKHSGLFCMDSVRLVDNSWRRQIVFADLVIALGNDFVKATYENYNLTRVDKISIFYRDSGTIELDKKNFTIAKQNFLWWGSAGAIHKGLDLLIEYFSLRKDINLYICGYRKESPFDSFLQQAISEHPNIFDMGFVDVGSEEHFDLLYKCASTILPSASEGGSPGIVNSCSTAGLIPIITKNCGLDVPLLAQEFTIDSLDIESIGDCIEKVLAKDSLRIRELSKELISYFRLHHAADLYKKNLYNKISTVVVNI